MWAAHRAGRYRHLRGPVRACDPAALGAQDADPRELDVWRVCRAGAVRPRARRGVPQQQLQDRTGAVEPLFRASRPNLVFYADN